MKNKIPLPKIHHICDLSNATIHELTDPSLINKIKELPINPENKLFVEQYQQALREHFSTIQSSLSSITEHLQHMNDTLFENNINPTKLCHLNDFTPKVLDLIFSEITKFSPSQKAYKALDSLSSVLSDSRRFNPSSEPFINYNMFRASLPTTEGIDKQRIYLRVQTYSQDPFAVDKHISAFMLSKSYLSDNFTVEIEENKHKYQIKGYMFDIFEKTLSEFENYFAIMESSGQFHILATRYSKTRIIQTLPSIHDGLVYIQKNLSYDDPHANDE